MSTVANALAIILIAVCLGTAILDIIRPDEFVQRIARLKIPRSGLPMLAVYKVACAAGLVVGFGTIRIGEAAGMLLCLYFAVAVTTHTRVKDSLRDTFPALAMLTISVLFVLVTFAK